jgi:hypothetical protein
MTPKHRNMKARNEYTARRVPELIAQWQWDHADEWERAKAEGWSGDLMQELRKLAYALAHRLACLPLGLAVHVEIAPRGDWNDILRERTAP